MSKTVRNLIIVLAVFIIADVGLIALWFNKKVTKVLRVTAAHLR